MRRSNPLGAARVAAGVAAFALSLGVARDVRANGRFPEASQLVLSPRDPAFFALRATFGLLVTHDAGAHWDWICERAIGYAGSDSEDPAIAMTERALLAGTLEGLAVSPDDGCGWSFGSPEAIVDLAVRRESAREALALISKYRAVDDAGLSTFTTKVLASDDDGAHWSPRGVTIESDVLAETIDVAPSAPHRIYISGARPEVPMGVLLVSMDDGAHYVEHEITLDWSTETAPFIAAIDPTNADRLYVRVKGTNGSRILVSDDAGATFRTVFTGAGDLLGFALSPKGDKVYVGGPKDGVLVASSVDLKFVKKTETAVQCLASGGATGNGAKGESTLYACMTDAQGRSGRIIAASTDDGATFDHPFDIGCMRGLVTCPSSASAAACATELPAIRATLGATLCQDPQGHENEGAIDAGAPLAQTPPEASGCACDTQKTTAARATSAFALTAFLALIAVVARFRRSRAARRR